ncbi:glycosyltransferase family 4 protein [Metallosphaera tengchongensis]|uniref:Glycosyltransferase family 4 protein n=1 Tax=Metallosphaera tengchongensis TaxID=1532350 RepID=A0A6N0NSA6_9CREN|nr:glycosyltransferase family 4 protein [Metallosphaera tengchongensis]QKQ99074.1 glycosyltransferase family 4 protein [Metallosphaera tengchongensis]
MKILAVVDFGLNERSGGYQRNLEIMGRLPKLAKVNIVPSIRNLSYAFNYGRKGELVSVLKGLNSTSGELMDNIRDSNSVEEFESRLRKEEYDVAVVYSNSSENVRLARKITDAPLGVQLQLEPFYLRDSTLFRIKFRGPTGRALEKFERALRESRREREVWLRLISEGNLNFAISVSRIPLLNSGLDSYLPYEVPSPANALPEGIMKFREDEKEDFAVYFTRLIPEKGLFEVPIIWKRVNERRDVRLYVMGEFQDERDKVDFLNMVDRLKVNVEYLGFKEGEDLYRVVSRARFTLYPSHYDSFSLVVLESLGLKTPVLAYRTQAMMEIFGEERGVVKIEEDNIKGMAEAALRLNAEVGEGFVRKFLSWDRVVEAELMSIMRIRNFILR